MACWPSTYSNRLAHNSHAIIIEAVKKRPLKRWLLGGHISFEEWLASYVRRESKCSVVQPEGGKR